MKELDVKLSKQYIQMVDEKERKQREEFAARELRTRLFME